MLQHSRQEKLFETLVLHMTSAPGHRLMGLNYGTNFRSSCEEAKGNDGVPAAGAIIGAGSLDVRIDRGYTPDA